MSRDRYFGLRVSLFVALTSFLACEIILFRSGHIFDGDYALYISQAMSLSHGTQYKLLHDMQEMLNLSTYKFYSPTLYPWGFPLLLTIPVALFGINYIVLKILLCLCVLFTFCVLYYDYCKRCETVAGSFVLLFLGLNFDLYSSTDWIISTLPYMLVLVVSLTCIRNYNPTGEASRKNILWGVIVGLALFLTIQIRTEGLMLIPALILYQVVGIVVNRKKIRLQRTTFLVLLLPYASLLLLGLITLPILPPGFLEHSSHFNALTPQLVINNIFYCLNECPKLVFPFFDQLGIWGTMLFWAMVIVALFKCLFRYTADVVYLVAHISLLCVWPYQNARYLLPLLPLLLYFFIKGMAVVFILSGVNRKRLFYIMQSSLLGLTVMFFILQITNHDNRYNTFDMDVENPNAKAMLAFLNEHTLPTDIIGCCESRAIYLYTGRIACNLFSSVYDTTSKADWYVVFNNRGGYLQHPLEVLNDDSRRFKLMLVNDEFSVYKIEK